MPKNVLLLVVVVLLGLAYLFITGSGDTSSDSLAVRTLQAQGFEQIQTKTTAAGYCESGEHAYAFAAVRPGVGVVQGFVCVRFFPSSAYIKYH
jgi:hypothetical protein